MGCKLTPLAEIYKAHMQRKGMKILLDATHPANHLLKILPSVYSGTCPVGWEQYDQHCFKFISSLKTWAEAERSCLLLGGNLASVHSVAEYHFIQGLIMTLTHGSPTTWIGGSDAQQEGIWFWSDGSRFAFTYWRTGEPNNNNGAEHCLQMNYGEMCPEDWEEYEQRCFKFISTAMTWAEAESSCLVLGGHLASVHSVTEHYFLQELILANAEGSPLAWIGGSDAQQDGIWFWSDGSRFAFTLWGTGKPNNWMTPESCLQMNAKEMFQHLAGPSLHCHRPPGTEHRNRHHTSDAPLRRLASWGSRLQLHRSRTTLRNQATATDVARATANSSLKPPGGGRGSRYSGCEVSAQAGVTTSSSKAASSGRSPGRVKSFSAVATASRPSSGKHSSRSQAQVTAGLY
ncbi:C-type mannose receptor 2-like [Alosa pseudoharengus]|uniref:C-type mannose receptor 2-like n=1 Tax=Alosa pseudoharengus TaxID=34774 RepID=UPI003F898EC7